MNNKYLYIQLLIFTIIRMNFCFADLNKNHDTKDHKSTKANLTNSLVETNFYNKQKSEKDLKLVLSGLNLLIRSEKSEFKKNELILSKAATLLALGKHFYLTGKTLEDKKTKETYLFRAMTSAAELKKSNRATESLKARSLHVFGMASLYMADEAKAVDYFDQAIKMDPKAPINPRLSVFIGEFYFDKEQYDKALPYYGNYFPKLTNEEKALALYKSGWCFLVTKQYENAEKAFLKIAGKTWAGDFGTDALRDLAQSVTSHLSEVQIIQFGVENFQKSSVDELVNFYTDCFMILIHQSGNIERIALYEEIIRLEKKPEKKVALAIKKMSSHQKGFATLQVYKDISEIDELINQYLLKPETEVFRFFGADLEVEIKRSISAYVETVSKKIKTPETITDIELATRLQKFLWFHVTWFPKSASVQQSYIIAMDNCAFLKDAQCSLRIGRLVLKQENLKSVWHRARIEILTSLESISIKNSNFKSEYVQELKNFSESQSMDKDWLIFTKKLTIIYFNDKLFANAEPFLIRILQKEFKLENLYRKIYCQFQLQKYSDVVLHFNQIPKEGPLSNEIKTIIRESSLSLAKNEIANNNFSDYEKYLFQFLNLNPEPDKASIAKGDYLQKLVDRQAFDKAITFFNQIPSPQKFQGQFAKTMEQLLVTLFSMNRFNEASEILGNGSVFGQFRNFDGYWFRIFLAKNNTLDEKELKLLSTTGNSARISILSLVALSNPEIVIRYFNQALPVDDKEKRIWILSRQMNEGSKILTLTNREVQFLSTMRTSEFTAVAPLKSERLSKFIEFPQTTWSQEKLARITPDAMERIKSIRLQIKKDLIGQTFDVQKRIITNGINIEKKMAWFFDESPIPPGIGGAELLDYKKEIDNFAMGYYQQIDEYEKFLSVILAKESEVISDRLPLPNNFEVWKRSNSSSIILVDSEMRKRQFVKSLIILESLKFLEKISVEDFYRVRTFIVMNKFPNEVASNYLQDELLAFKQFTVLNDWKNMVGLEGNLERSIASENKSDVTNEKRK